MPEYERLEPDESGLLRSEVFPGLWLDTAAMIGRDMPKVLQRVQEGLATPEHAQFVTRLQQAREQPEKS
jgi:hypothetical protein